jgi:hypothetical protein
MLAPMGDRSLKRYNKKLQQTYPDCRIRWSERQEVWLLERKARFARLDINPKNYPSEAVDTFIQLRDGYYRAGRYEPTGLPPVELLVKILLANDTALMAVEGKTPEDQANAWCDAAEEMEREAKRRAAKEQTFEHSGIGSDMYDQLAWAEGRRVSVPRNLPEG